MLLLTQQGPELIKGLRELLAVLSQGSWARAFTSTTAGVTACLESSEVSLPKVLTWGQSYAHKCGFL